VMLAPVPIISWFTSLRLSSLLRPTWTNLCAQVV
jgi:hypothetical protein